jgi:penicillin-binding protein 1C
LGYFLRLGADLSGPILPPLLFKIFNTVDHDNDKEWFSHPADCDIRKVCSETGLIPSDHCTDIVTDYFIPLVSSTKICDNRQETLISADEKIAYCKSCAPATGYKKKWYKITDADMQAWLDENGITYQKIPRHNPDCELIFKGNAPVVISPVNGTEYLVNKKDREPLQLFKSLTMGKVYWYIDNKFYKSCNTTRSTFVPTEGPIKISVLMTKEGTGCKHYR